MKPIIIVKPNTLSAKDREKLTKNGNVVIIHENADEIVFKEPQQEYTHTNCASCGERIYMLQERLAFLKSNGQGFYCTQGHSNIFRKKS